MSNVVVTSSPHIRGKAGTSSIMRDVVIALLPAAIAAVILFGIDALVVTLISVVSCVLLEFIYTKLMKKPTSIGNMSAVVTGLLLAFCLPPSLPIWMVIVGAFVSIIAVKQLFGGIGSNFANPAIVGRLVLMVSFPAQMSKFPPAIDSIAGATPLSGGATPSYFDMLIGNMGGSLGEVCAIVLILGGIYLVARRVITATIPLSFLGTVAVISFVFGGNSLFRGDPLYHLLTGGIVLGAIFMATDYVTSPTTESGKLIFGVACGAITMLIRLTGAPEGVSYAILLMNILTPYIDNATKSKPLGGVVGE